MADAAVRFRYRAGDGTGAVKQGELEAADRAGVIDRLRRDGLTPISLKPAHAPLVAPWSAPVIGGLAKRLRRRPAPGPARVLFTRQLATLLGASLPVDRALAAIARQGDPGSLSDAAERLRDRLRAGASLADAMAQDGALFPPHYVGLVRAGEAGGTLDTVLAELADSLERAQELEREVASSLQYPVIVLVVAGLSIVVLLVAVVPEFEPLFQSGGGDLPLSTRAVLALSDGLRHSWHALLVAVLVLLLAIDRGRRNARVKMALDRAALSVPLFGGFVAGVETARFARSLGTLLTNGVDLVPSLDLALNTVVNSHVAACLDRVRPALKRGEGLTRPLVASGVVPDQACQLIQIGEESGRLGEMLLTTARLYDQNTRRTTQRLVALLVPAVTIVLGAVVALVVGAILSAILTAYDLPL